MPVEWADRLAWLHTGRVREHADEERALAAHLLGGVGGTPDTWLEVRAGGAVVGSATSGGESALGILVLLGEAYGFGEIAHDVFLCW